MNSLKPFWQYLSKDKRSIYSIITYTLVTSVLVLAIPFIIQEIIQHYSLLVFQTSSAVLILVFATTLVVITLMRILQMWLSEFLQRRIFVRAFDDTRSSYASAKKTGGNVSPKRWNYVFESINLQKTLIPLLIEGVTFVLQTIFVILLICVYHPVYILYSLVLIGAFYWIVIHMGKRTLAFAISECDKKHNVIELLETQTEQAEMLDDSLAGYMRTRHMRFKSYMAQSVGIFVIKIVAAVFLIIIGGLLIFQNQMTIGQLIASELLLTNLLISLFKFTNVLDYFYDSVVAVKKLNLLNPNNSGSGE